MRNDEIKRAQPADVWIAIMVLGSLWGLSETALSGVITAAGLPYRAGILTGVGIGLLAVAVAAFRKPLILPAIAAVAILCKQLVVPILHVSVMCKANSCLAVMVEGLVLAGGVTLAGRKLHRGTLARIASGALAALSAAAAFYFVGMRVAPCRYLLTFDRPGGLQAFMVAEGLVWAVFSGLLFPAGYWVGARLEDSGFALGRKNPLAYYVTSAVLVVLCWLASAFAIAAGF